MKLAVRGALLVLVVACSSKASTNASPTAGSVSPYPCSSAVACAQACDGHDAAACGRAAELLFEGEAFDLTRSFAYAKRACDAGNLVGCSMLGLHYQDGLAIEWAPAKAVEVYTRACSGGEGVGCYNLSSMYVGGHGIDADLDKAARYKALAKQAWDTACHGNAPRWCTNLAFLLLEDTDSPPTVEAALVLDQRACDHGVLVGCTEALQRRRALGKIARRRSSPSCARCVRVANHPRARWRARRWSSAWKA